MLDQLSDTDLERRPRPAAKSSGNEESIRHLTHPDLEAYANGQLAAARLEHCRTHLESCDACRAELEDLRLFKSEMAGFERATANSLEQQRRKRRRGPSLLLVGSATVVLAVGVGGAAFWWGHKGSHPQENKTPVAASAARPTVAPPAAADASMRTRDMRPAAHESPRMAAKAAPASLPTATPVADAKPVVDAKPAVDTQPTVSETNKAFALLGPLGGPISDTRPEFTWEPLPGAVKYSVVIVDSGLHRVQRSPALRKTVWRPRHPLRRGRTYLWQVTATLRGGHKVVASAPGTLIESAADSPHE